MVIKIPSTIYLLLVVLFISVQLYWHHESRVHKTRKFVRDTAKKGSTSNRRLSTTIRPLKKIFKLYKVISLWFKGIILSGWSRKLKYNPRRYSICSSIFFCFSKRDISANNAFVRLVLWKTVILYINTYGVHFPPVDSSQAYMSVCMWGCPRRYLAIICADRWI